MTHSRLLRGRDKLLDCELIADSMAMDRQMSRCSRAPTGLYRTKRAKLLGAGDRAV